MNVPSQGPAAQRDARRTVTMIRDTAATDRPVDGSGRRRRRLAIGIALVLALLLAAVLIVPSYLRWIDTGHTVARERVRLGEVTRGDFVRDVSVQGRVVAAVSPTLYSPVAGTVTLTVQAGDSVQQGQVLATIDSPELDNRLATERSALQSAEVALQRQRIQAKTTQLENRQRSDLAQVVLEAADRELRRAEAAHASRVINDIDYEKARDDLSTARLEHEHAVQDATLQDEALSFELKTRELELERQRLLVADLERRVAELTVRSPATGIVGTLAVEQKAAVIVNQPLLSVVDLSALEVDIKVPESYADDLGLGMNVELTYGRARFAGVLKAISPEIRDGQVAGRVRFAGDVPVGLKQNQRVSARVLLDERPDVLTVPRGPFFESGGGRVAYVVQGDIATRRSIRTGVSSVERIEVLEGLAAGETIVLSDLDPFEGADTVYLSD